MNNGPAGRIIGSALSEQEKRLAGFTQSLLAAHNQEMAQKTAILLNEYLTRYIKPLEARIQYLEMPWWRKVMVRIEEAFVVWRWNRAKKARQSTKVDIAPAEPTPELDPAA